VQRLLREGGGKLSDEIPPPTPDEQAEAVHEVEDPQLLMPGIAPPPAPVNATRPATRVARAPLAPTSAAASGEVERLQAVLIRTLAELEALRALL